MDIKKNSKKRIYNRDNNYLSLYESLTGNIENRLDEADLQASSTEVRLSHDEVFSKLRYKIKAN